MAIEAIGAGKTGETKKKQDFALGDAASAFAAKAQNFTNSIFGAGFASSQVDTSASNL